MEKDIKFTLMSFGERSAEICTGNVAAIRAPLSSLDDAVRRTDLGLAGINSYLVEDWHQRGAEALEGLHRIPDLGDAHFISLTVANMIQPPLRRTCPCFIELADDFVVLLRIQRSWRKADC